MTTRHKPVVSSDINPLSDQVFGKKTWSDNGFPAEKFYLLGAKPFILFHGKWRVG